jgi:hypothetical protein
MTIEGQISKPLSAGSMLAITGGAFVAGSLIVFGAILPAELNWDPLGFGRTTGLNRLWAPREVTFDTTNCSWLCNFDCYLTRESFRHHASQ